MKVKPFSLLNQSRPLITLSFIAHFVITFLCLYYLHVMFTCYIMFCLFSASLTYLPSTVHTPTPAHSSSPGQTEIASLAESTDMFSISLHHQLLSSNAGLISSIPSLLQNSPHFTQHECLGSSSDSCCVKKDPVFEYLEIFPPLKEPFGCLATSQRKVRDEKRLEGEDPGQACDLICSNRSQFWNQLEHFKIQAQSLEFISSHD